MLKKTITYKDYNGLSRTETLYFNLNKAELTEMNMSVHGGMVDLLQRMINTNDNVELFKMFKDIILKSYGIKDPDGKRFIKNDQVRDDFVQSEAYNVILMELLGSTQAVSDFVIGIMPEDIQDEARAEMAKRPEFTAENE